MNTITFGRADDCDVVFDDKIVSRHHGYLVVDGKDVYLVDNDSTNGTFVNGRRVQGRVKLSSRDEVMISRKYRMNWKDYVGFDDGKTVPMQYGDETVRGDEVSDGNDGSQNNNPAPRSSSGNGRPLIEIPSKMEINQNYAEVYRNGEKGADWKVPFRRNMGGNIGNAVGKTLGLIFSIILIIGFMALAIWVF